MKNTLRINNFYIYFPQVVKKCGKSGYQIVITKMDNFYNMVKQIVGMIGIVLIKIVGIMKFWNYHFQHSQFFHFNKSLFRIISH